MFSIKQIIENNDIPLKSQIFGNKTSELTDNDFIYDGMYYYNENLPKHINPEIL